MPWLWLLIFVVEVGVPALVHKQREPERNEVAPCLSISVLLLLIFAFGRVPDGGKIVVALRELHMSVWACHRTLVEQQERRNLAGLRKSSSKKKHHSRH